LLNIVPLELYLMVDIALVDTLWLIVQCLGLIICVQFIVSFHVEISIFWISSIRSFTLARLVDTLVIGLLMINDNFIFLDATKLKDFANILSCSFSLFVDVSIMGYDYKDRIKL
jgi:hypothetical protein